MTTTRIIGIYKNTRAAADAFDQLAREGFARESISVLLSDSSEGRAFLAGDRSRAAEGALTGTTVGGVLAALAAGALALPGIGVIAAGPIAAALSGAGVGAASGGVLGALIGLGIPENEAALRSKDVQDGAILIGVEAEDQSAESARQLLMATGASHVLSA